MGLTTPPGGAGDAGASPGQRGSQAIEFALVTPAVALLVLLLVQAALLGAEIVAVQGLAREAARAAAVDDDEAVRAAVTEAGGGRAVEVELEPPSGRRLPGDLVTALVRLRSAALARFGVTVWLPARATMRTETDPSGGADGWADPGVSVGGVIRPRRGDAP
ncbi:MAG: hypothetical protein KY434_07025 [Actinobacteria bacterium]|nr:hypothetical protein [Actinomycetota bacterium]